MLIGPKCDGPMRMIAFIQDKRVARKILEHLGQPSRAPPRNRSRRSGQLILPVEEHPDFDGIDALVD